MKIAALMLSGEALYGGTGRASYETWLQDFDAIQIHGFAPCEFLPVTRVGMREGKQSCFDKRHQGLKSAWRSAPRCDWYLCCSCDCYFWADNLRKALSEIEQARTPFLVGGPKFHEHIADGTYVEYPPGGAGYCLNRLSMALLLRELDRLRAEWFRRAGKYESEDVFNGWACAQLGIKYIQHPGFHQVPPGREACGFIWPQGVPHEQAISYHYMTADEIWNYRKQHRAS